jgi:triphosphatase
MSEVELKFLFENEKPTQLTAGLREAGFDVSRPRIRSLSSIYFDTQDLRLRNAGYSLRLRREGRSWVQTVKTKRNIQTGLSQADEYTCPAPGKKLQLAAIPDKAVRKEIQQVLAGEMPEPLFETRMKRTIYEVKSPGGTLVEFDIDDGEIIAGEIRAPLKEAELELILGRIKTLYDVAEEVFCRGDLKFSHMSKAQRGYRLADKGDIGDVSEPRKAGTIDLSPEMTAEEAAQAILRECFEQIANNRNAVLRLDDPEGPHQLRIGLRRLRSAFSIFKPAIGNPETRRLSQEAKWLGQEVGELRDLDVAVIDIVDPEHGYHPEEAGFPKLKDALLDRGNKRRETLRDILKSERTKRFLIDLTRFIETRSWLIPTDIDQSRRLTINILKFANSALAKRWKAVTKKAKGIDQLSIEQRHELRKELKKFRYSIEFFAPLYRKKRIKAFVNSLKQLQEVFGYLNDVKMAQTMFTGADAPGAGHPQIEHSKGLIIGARQAKAENAWHDAKALWRALKKEKRFWS